MLQSLKEVGLLDIVHFIWKNEDIGMLLFAKLVSSSSFRASSDFSRASLVGSHSAKTVECLVSWMQLVLH